MHLLKARKRSTQNNASRLSNQARDKLETQKSLQLFFRGRALQLFFVCVVYAPPQPSAGRKRHSFVGFPYVCPEPVLVKSSFLYLNGA
jgi:hypothetical protein